jgi:radical SAM superfamily enzyme YgiQ (UPF0313 family)
MVTSTGCPFRCAFCAIAPLPRYLNPLDRVLEEVRECVERHAIREIDFFDADFLCDRPRALELCRRLGAFGSKLEWSCRTRIDSIDREVLALAKSSGCRQMYVGLETADPGAQKRLRKVVSPSGARERLRWMRDAGIRPLGFFMLGVPGETQRTCWETIRWARELPLDYAQFSRMVAKPGSELHRELVERSGSDYWRDHVLGRKVAPRIPNTWSRVGEKGIERYTKLAYLIFYYRPGAVLRGLLRLRSFDEAARSLRSALRMLRHFLHTDQKDSREN